MMLYLLFFFFFFFNDTATTEIYTLSLHDALPIYIESRPTLLVAIAANRKEQSAGSISAGACAKFPAHYADRKSTRLNSSHLVISYAVFCLKKKKTIQI